MNGVALKSVTGLVFVFYDSSSMIRQAMGMKNTYRITSCVWFAQHAVTHGVTFKSNPSK